MIGKCSKIYTQFSILCANSGNEECGCTADTFLKIKVLFKNVFTPILNVHLMSFCNFIYLCNHYHNQDKAHFQHPKKLSRALSQSVFP